MDRVDGKTLLIRALRRRCLICGQGAMFRSHFRINRTCPVCNVTFWSDPGEGLGAMYLERTQRFTMASKFLWPLPDRGLKKRAYRISAPTLILWGESDRLIPPVYAKEFARLIKGSRVQIIKEAGHMVMYEQRETFVKSVSDFLRS